MLDIHPETLCLVKHFEGLYLDAYLCPAGVPTIGYGHTAGIKMGQTISRAQADALLVEDMIEAGAAVDRMVKVTLSPAQRGALASFVFNLGEGRFRTSTLLKKLNKGDFEGAALQLRLWVKATVRGEKVTLPGLVKRRGAEELLFRGLDWRGVLQDEPMPQAVEVAGPKPLSQSVTAKAAAGGLGLGAVISTIGPLIAPTLEITKQVREAAEQAQLVAAQVQQAQEQVTGVLEILHGIAAQGPAVGAAVMGVGLLTVLYRLWKDRRQP